MKTVQYLDAAKRALGITSDYALAQRLELTKQGLAKLRHGDAVMSPTTAAKVAAILELDPMRVIADAELERGSDSALWKRLRDAAAAILVAIGAVLAAPQPAYAGFNNNFLAASAVLAFPVRRRRLAEVFPQGDSNTHCRTVRSRPVRALLNGDQMRYEFTEHGDYIRAVIGDDATLDDFVEFYREMKMMCASRGVDRAMVVVSHSAGSIPTFEQLSSYAGAGFMGGFKLALVCAGWALYRACQKAERAAGKAGVQVRAFFQETEGSRWLSGK